MNTKLNPEFVALISHLMSDSESYAVVTPCDDMNAWTGPSSTAHSAAELLELLDGPSSVTVFGDHQASFTVQPDESEFGFQLGYDSDDADCPIVNFVA